MKNGMGFPLVACGLLGIIGLIAMSANFYVGGAIVLLAIFGVVFSRLKLEPKRLPEVQMVIPNEKADHQAMMNLVDPLIQSVERVDRKKMGVLLYTLNQTGLDTNVPVFFGPHDHPYTVRHILEEVLRIAEREGQPVEALAKDIVAIYPKMWDAVEEAISQFTDAEEICTFVAHKAMIDVQWKFDKP